MMQKSLVFFPLFTASIYLYLAGFNKLKNECEETIQAGCIKYISALQNLNLSGKACNLQD